VDCLRLEPPKQLQPGALPRPPEGTGLKRLTFTRGSDGALGDDGLPTWRPDGGSLVFVSNRDRNFELYSLAVDWRPAAPEARIELFDGQSTEGWTMTGPGGFTVEGRALVTQGGMGCCGTSGAPSATSMKGSFTVS
jgi:hypothetical protein